MKWALNSVTLISLKYATGDLKKVGQVKKILAVFLLHKKPCKNCKCMGIRCN